MSGRYRLCIEGREIAYDPEALPDSEVGRRGSILQVALWHGVRVSHTCGGVPSCTTCHVRVREGGEGCSPISVQEERLLQKVYGRNSESRLACQCVPRDDRRIVVVIP